MRIFYLKDYIEKGLISAVLHVNEGGPMDHSHDCFELDYFIEGRGEYSINGFNYQVEPGALFLNSPADFHHIRVFGAKWVTVMFPCAVFEPELLYALFQPNRDPFFLIPEKDRVLLEQLLNETIELAEKKPKDALHFLRCVLVKAFQLTSPQKKHPHSHVQAAIVYILEHFRTGITLSATAEHIGLAPAYLSSLFKQEVGQTFKEYVDNLRFYYAAHLLHTTDHPASEVCAFAGFNDYVNFSRRFRQKFGKSPRNLRSR